MAPAASSARADAVQISNLDCSKVTFTTLTCTFNTNVPASVSVAAGTHGNPAPPLPDAHLRTDHVITVRGLEPNTSYFAKITAAPKSGKPVNPVVVDFEDARNPAQPHLTERYVR